ncbi:MAG: hypothetical protein GY820_11385 [Gammaproteobacteria bacterium]|nr:hypothetical protein [Gammaproteobacteria bacterium]
MQKVIDQLPAVMVLGTYRQDECPQLPEQLPGSQELILDRLNEAEVAQLSRAMLGGATNSPCIASLLMHETKGNTFFIIEVMRTLAEEAGRLDKIGAMTLPEGVFTGGVAQLLQQRVGDAAVLIVRDNQWEFTHDKLRETILLELDAETKRDLHHQAAEALEAVYPEDANLQ